MGGGGGGEGEEEKKVERACDAFASAAFECY